MLAGTAARLATLRQTVRLPRVAGLAAVPATIRGTALRPTGVGPTAAPQVLGRPWVPGLGPGIEGRLLSPHPDPPLRPEAELALGRTAVGLPPTTAGQTPRPEAVLGPPTTQAANSDGPGSWIPPQSASAWRLGLGPHTGGATTSSRHPLPMGLYSLLKGCPAWLGSKSSSAKFGG